MQLSIFKRSLKQLSEGAYHIPDFLSPEEQQHLLSTCRKSLLSLRMKGFDLEHPKTHYGEMKVGVASLGHWWRLYQHYLPPRVPVPELIYEFCQRAIAEVGLVTFAGIETVSAILQHYDPYKAPGVKLGLHRDDSEDKSLLGADAPPVVSFSLGCDAVFLWGGAEYTSPKEKVILLSGDVVLFGGHSRLFYHGINKVLPDTEPTFLKTRGRLNITVRQAVRAVQ